MNRPALVALLMMSLLSVARAPGAAPAAPSTPANAPASAEDVKAAFERGDYAETLKLLSRILSLKGKAADGIDRYELLMLRAESHLRLGKQTDALRALDEAAKVAATDKDEKQLADAHALSILIKRSKALQFTPKTPVGKGKDDKGPLDIANPEKRKVALQALYDEEKAAAKPKVQAAEKSKTLPDIAKALKAVGPLKELELAASGKDAETGETTKDLVERAHKLMAKALDDMTKRTTRISDHANESVPYYYTRPDGVSETRYQKRGLDKNDTKDLKEVVETAKKIATSCKELAAGFTSDAEPFEDLEDVAKDAATRAHDVLTDNYAR